MFRQLTQKRSSRKQRALASAHSESLEPRILLTGQVEITVRSGPPLEGEGSVLDVRGTEDDDRLVAHMVDGQLTITSLSENVALPLLTNSQIQGTVLFQSDGTENIVAIEMSGVQGDDYLHNMTGMLSFLLGDSYWEWDGPETLECVIDCDPTVGGNDILIGGHGKDYLYGRGGDDFLDGRAGEARAAGEGVLDAPWRRDDVAGDADPRCRERQCKYGERNTPRTQAQRGEEGALRGQPAHRRPAPEAAAHHDVRLLPPG